MPWATSARYEGTLPAGGSGDRWYAVSWLAGGPSDDPNAPYHPHVYLESGRTQYVFDLYYDFAQSALDRQQVPITLKDFVRDYFSRLEPVE